MRNVAYSTSPQWGFYQRNNETRYLDIFHGVAPFVCTYGLTYWIIATSSLGPKMFPSATSNLTHFPLTGAQILTSILLDSIQI